MIPENCLRSVHPGLTTLFIFLSGILSVSAQLPELEVSVGFDRLFVQDSQTPVAVTVRSPETPLEAQLVLEFNEGTALERGSSYRIRRDISLPAGFSAVYRFVLPLRSSTYPLRVRLENRGLLLARRELELRPMVARGPLVVGLSRRPSLDGLIPVLSRYYQRRPELRYPRSEYLPPDPRGWEGADLVIWHDLPPDLPDPDSLEALGLWLRSGGTLVIVDGPWLVGSAPTATLFPSGSRSPPAGPGEEPVQTIGRGRLIHLPDGPGLPERLEDLLSETRPPGEFSGARVREYRHSIDEGLDRLDGLLFDDGAPVSGRIGSLIVFPLFFLGMAGTLLFIGRRITESRTRAFQLASLALVSLAVSSAVFFLPASRVPDPEIRKANITISSEEGPVFRYEQVLMFSPRGRGAEYGMDIRELVRSSEDVSLRYESRGLLMEAPDLKPWKGQVLSFETVFPPEGRPGQTESRWYDLVLIAGGEARFLADEWDPGSQASDLFTSPENLEVHGNRLLPDAGAASEDSIGLPGGSGGRGSDRDIGEYRRIVDALAARSDNQPPIILGHGETGDLSLLLMLPDRSRSVALEAAP